MYLWDYWFIIINMYYFGENLVNEIGRVLVIFWRVVLKVFFLIIIKSLNVIYIFVLKILILKIY